MVPARSGSESPSARDQSQHEELYVFTVEAIRELDRLAVEEYGLTGAVLMENAARSVAAEALRFVASRGHARRIAICCGPGNNGGDGLAVARHLHNDGLEVQLLLAFDPQSATLSTEAAMNLHVCRRLRLPIIELTDNAAVDAFTATDGPPPDLIIDALLGTGSHAAPRPPMDRIIDWMNDSPSPVLSIDVPSGLDARTGRPPGACVKADITVALVGLKTGFLELDAQPWIGEIVIGDIGAPRELSERLGQRLAAEPYEPEEVQPARHRPRRSHGN